jgi:hypothetical protein
MLVLEVFEAREEGGLLLFFAFAEAALRLAVLRAAVFVLLS